MGLDVRTNFGLSVTIDSSQTQQEQSRLRSSFPVCFPTFHRHAKLSW
jgi:hypothetical protein